jgi:serine/threonine protein kinase/tetratricopeptide (TPR) repeat protein
MKEATSARVRFGAFELDLRAGELHKNGRKVRLQEQPFQVLRMLVERGGEVVSREEIQTRLWPNDTVVEFDHGINTAIRKLRTALEDSAEKPSYIETVARRGYRLIMPIEMRASSSDGSSPTMAVAATAVKPALQSSALAPGKTVSHYRVLNIIGGGGMGIVYRAEDLKLGRSVALKFLPEEVCSDPIALGRFEREARTASSLNHPNICTIYEVEEHESTPFIVMEYLEGMTLRELIGHAATASPLDKSAKAALPIDEVLDIAVQIADGLDAAHQRGIIHRDIKPANIFITRQHQVKILDFGLAKAITSAKEAAGEHLTEVGAEREKETPADPRPDPTPDNNLTREGASIGTLGYMSPEQVQGLKLDARTDLFCFGVVLYELVTGRKAFGTGTRDTFREAVLYQTPTPVRELVPEVPAKLEAIIDRCLQKERGERYQYASDVRNDLKEVRHEIGPHSSARVIGRELEQRIEAGPISGEDVLRQKRLRKWLLPAVAAMLVVVGVIWYAASHRPAAFTEADALVLGEIDNLTGDPVFDSSMNTAMKTALSQSPYIKLLTGDKVRRALTLMNQPADARLTPATSREICQRTNSKAFVTGSIADAGNHYRLELKAVDCHSDRPIASSQQDASSRDVIVKQLGIVAAELREGLGEPSASLRNFNKPLDEALTPSLEALQAFAESGKQKVRRGDVPDMFAGLKRAIDLDPKFAEAYWRLGIGYLNKNEVDASVKNFTKAYELRGRVIERTRLAIDTFYFLQVTGEAEKSVQSMTEWANTYPSDPAPRADLTDDLMAAGEYERAEEYGRESVRLQPTAIGYVNLMSANIRLGRWEEARKVFDEARSFNINDVNLYIERYLLAFLQNDAAGMEEVLNWAKDKPQPYKSVEAQADTEAFYGRIKKSQELSDKAVDSAKQAGDVQASLIMQLVKGLRGAESGNTQAAVEAVNQALAPNSQRDVRVLAALVAARGGDVAKAQAMADELNLAYPVDTWIQRHQLPAIRAAIELHRDNPAGAVAALNNVGQYDMADLTFRSFPLMYPVYLRGEAYLKSGQAQKAANEFQKIVDHPGIITNFITGALAYLQLGRAQAALGDKAAARNSYTHFFERWKNADPNLPILQLAKSEFAKL